MKTYELRLLADYHQFYLEDAEADPLTPAKPEFWNERAQTDGLASVGQMMAVGTARYGEVAVSVTVREAEPEDDFETWDHVVNAALEVPSGTLVVRGCTEPPETAEKLSVEPGTYRARVFYGNLEIDETDAEAGDDHYKVVLWPGAWREPQVVKRFGAD